MSQRDLPFEDEPGFRIIKPDITPDELRDEVAKILEDSLRRCISLEAWEEECLRRRGVEIIRSKHLC